MKSPGTVCTSLAILTVVGAGAWYANDPDLRAARQALFGPEIELLPEFSVNHIDWSEDGRVLLSVSRGGADAVGRLALHEATQGHATMPIDALGDSLLCAALAPNGHQVLAGSREGVLWWIDTHSSEAPHSLVELPRTGVSFTANAIAGDGRHVAGGTAQGTIYLGDRSQPCFVLLTTGAESSIAYLQFSSDSNRLVAAQKNGQVSVWEVETGELVRLFRADFGCRVAAFIPGGDQLLVTGIENCVWLYDIASGSERELWRGESGPFACNTLAVSADGVLAAWGGCYRKIVVWDLARGARKFEIATEASLVYELRFSHDGLHLAAAGSDGTIRLYDSRAGTECDRIEVGDHAP